MSYVYTSISAINYEFDICAKLSVYQFDFSGIKPGDGYSHNKFVYVKNTENDAKPDPGREAHLRHARSRQGEALWREEGTGQRIWMKMKY